MFAVIFMKLLVVAMVDFQHPISMLEREPIQDALNLTDDVRSEIKSIKGEYLREIAELPEHSLDLREERARASKVGNAQMSARKKMADLLDESQNDKWKGFQFIERRMPTALMVANLQTFQKVFEVDAQKRMRISDITDEWFKETWALRYNSEFAAVSDVQLLSSDKFFQLFAKINADFHFEIIHAVDDLYSEHLANAYWQTRVFTEGYTFFKKGEIEELLDLTSAQKKAIADVLAESNASNLPTYESAPFSKCFNLLDKAQKRRLVIFCGPPTKYLPSMGGLEVVFEHRKKLDL